MKPISYLILAVIFLAACTPREGSFSSDELELGVPVEGELAVETPDSYHLSLGPDMYLLGQVDQVTVDVVVTLYDTASNVIGRFDGPARGAEVFQFQTEEAGNYILEVAPFEKESGKYILELKVVEPVATDPAGLADQLFLPFSGEDVPGGVVGVMHDGKLIFSRAYGMADLANDIPFTVETPSNIGSVSKQFTAMAILLLEQQGKLSIDDDVRDYIPELPDLGQVVTLRNMLNHTNGFREVYNLMPMTGWKGTDQLRREDILEVLKRQEELQALPGEEFNYNNSAFIMLAEIVERVSGQKFPEFMKENIFGPLGMESTVVRTDPATIIPGASQGYVTDSTGFKYGSDLYGSPGAGGIYTTVADFNKWLENFHDPVLGDAALITRLVTPDTLLNGDTMDYAKGIAIGEYRGQRMYNHSGADLAHRAMLVYFPDLDAGVAVLSNHANCPVGNIAFKLASAFFEKDLETEESMEREEESAESKEVEIPERLLEAYAGKYKFETMPLIIEYTLEDGVLISSIEGQPDLVLVPESESTFSYTGVEAMVEFQLDENGEVTGAVHSQGGTDYKMVPLAPYQPSTEDLKAYEGRYFSPELEVFYTLELKDTTLLLHIRNTPEVELSALEEDVYKGDVFFIGELTFNRDERGKVTGFEVANGRTKGIRFELL